VGFALGMLVVLLAMSMATFRLPGSPASDPVGAAARGLETRDAIEIVRSEAVLPRWYIKIIGELRNVGPVPVSGGHLIADLYDNDGKFYFQCKTLQFETIAPGATTTFSVDCHGVTPEIWERYESYSIRIAY